MAKQTVDTTWTNKKTKAFGSDRANRIARNSVTSMGVSAAARDISTMRTYTDTYGVTISKTGDVTNQRQSGRCWMFSSFNVLRQEAIKKLDVETFEFSQAYGMFYDKLEKANAALEYIIQTADQPVDSRVVQTLLSEGISDGGYYSFAMSLVEKYGLVPKDAMPETACSKNSTQMDERIDRLFRKSADELRAAFAKGKSIDDLRKLKQKQLANFHQILSVCLGEPPLTFDFECKVGKDAQVDKTKLSPVEPKKASDNEDKKDDKKDGEKGEEGAQILRDFDITPLQFAKRYCGIDPRGYVQLISVPSKKYPYGKVYHPTFIDSVLGGIQTRFLNVEPEVLEAATIASLKDGNPVCMACDVMQEFPRHNGDFNYVLSTDTMDYSGLFGIDFDMNRTAMIENYETSLTHAMTFQGVELDKNGKAKQWRIENSWGKDAGKDGYLIMSADWFRLYGGEADVRRQYVPKELLKVWDEGKDVQIDFWENLGYSLGGRARK